MSRILSNPLYCGLIEWDGIISPGMHKKVVGKEEFNAVQKMKFSKAKCKGKIFLIADDLEKEFLK